MRLPFDLETIPAQGGAFDEFFEAEKTNFKAPGTLTKTQVLADFGVTDKDPDWKYKSKDECVTLWEERFAAIKAPEVAEEKWRKTALDGTRGEIVVIGFMLDGAAESMHRQLNESEGDLLQNFYDTLARHITSTKPLFIGHNIGGFDLKFLFQRSVILGVEPSVNLPIHGRHGQDYFDNMVEWTGNRNSFIKQDALAKALGLPGKPDDIDGSKVWDFVRDGMVERVAEYCCDDVAQAHAIYRRLNFIDKPAPKVTWHDDGLPF